MSSQFARSNTAVPGSLNSPIENIPLYLAQGVRKLDETLINRCGIPGYTLMCNAAKFAYDTALKRWPDTELMIILCGSGNNGGDGYVIARLAKESGLEVQVLALSETEHLKNDARKAYLDAVQSGVEIQAFDASIIQQAQTAQSLIVDAMLGTGLNTEVKGLYADAIKACNESSLPILAVDIPSGLSADTGRAMGAAIEADITTTFIGMKVGLLTGHGRHYAGEIYFDKLSTPETVYASVKPAAASLGLNNLLAQIRKRAAHAHKGHYGHTLLIGGNSGYAGALMMATLACLRMGSGLSTVATREESVQAFTTCCPEAMARGVRHLNDLETFLCKSTQLVVGPGLGQDAWAEQILFAAIQSVKPMVLDADALNLLARNPEWKLENTEDWLLTPHPGEAARLLGCTTKEVERDRLASVRKLSTKYGCSVILKGSGSLICHDGKEVDLCPYGNPGMAIGGMGDVLSGLLGGLLAQEDIQSQTAIGLAVCLHAKAADILAAQQGERGLLASDLIPIARALLNRQLEP